MNVVIAVVAVLLAFSAVAATWRVVVGPSILDRMIASDVLLVTVMLTLLSEMAYHEHTRTLPVVLVIALLSFTGSVGVARYVSNLRPPR